MRLAAVHRRPWPELVRLQRDMHRWFEGSPANGLFPAAAYPLVNLWQGDTGFVLTAEIPGVEMSALNVEVQTDSVTLKGPRPAPISGADEQFTRVIPLPSTVDPSTAVATYERGVLTVKLTPPAAALPRQVAVTAG